MLLPQTGDTLVVDMIAMADLTEETDGSHSELQAALSVLIKDSVIENTHAKRLRTVNVVNYPKSEMLRRSK